MSRYVDLFKNIGLFAISNIAVKLVVFLMVPLYTYFLSTSEYGVTDLLNSTIHLLIPLTTLSISDAVLRFCVSDRQGTKEYVSVGVKIVFASCILVTVALPALDLPFFGGLGQYKIWFLLSYAVMCFHTLFSNIARGIDQISLMAKASIASSLINICSAFIFIMFLHLGIYGFFLSLIIGNMSGCLYYIILGGHWRLISFKQTNARSVLKPMLLYSIPLIPNALFWWATQSINRFFITGIISVSASGLFAAASKIPGILNLFAGIFQQAWNLSAFQQFKEKGKEVFFNKTFRFFNAGMMACTSILILLSKPLSGIFLQRDFFNAWSLTPLLLIAFYHGTLSAFYGSIYTSSMKTKGLFITTLIGAITCVVFSIPLVLRFGLVGACIATVLSNLLVWIVRVIHSRSILKIDLSTPVVLFTNFLLLAEAILITYDSPNSVFFACAASLLLIGVEVWELYSHYSSNKE